MTAALKSQTGANANTRSALAARLDLLLRHAISAQEFENDVSTVCTADPEDIWVVLALLDQYHRLGKLPTELFRTLKSAADQRGLGRRGVPVSKAQRTVRPAASAPEREPTPNPAPAAASGGAAATPAAPATPATPATPAAPAAPAAATRSEATVAPPPARVPPPQAAGAPVASRLMTPPTARAATQAMGGMPAIGTVLRSRYLLTAELDRDHRGTLYLAVDQSATELAPELRCVSILVLTPNEADVAATLAELRQEFRDARQLNHPNIVRVRELDHDGTWFFLTMDQVPGESLRTLLERRHRKALPRAAALAILREVGAAVAHAHQNGIAHGDLQPDAVQISSTGEVRVRGFGAVRAGSSYASCEQLENLPPDRRDDLYALACMAYELLQGAHPFGRLNAAAARGRGLVPVRPLMLTRSQWQALRIGLAWRRENRTVGVTWWLAQMRLGEATPRLPALEALVALPPPRRSWRRPLLLVALLAAALAALAASDRLPDRAQLLAGLAQLRSAVDGAPMLWHRLELRLTPKPASTPAAASPAAVVPTSPFTTPPAPSLRPSHRPHRAARDLSPTAPSPDAPSADAPAADASPPTAPPSVVASPGDVPDAASADRATAQPILELSSDNYTVLPGESVARLVVRRVGQPQGTVSFAWWTEGASAIPGRDYVDWGRRTEFMPAGRASITLLVPIISDVTRRGRTRTFYVAIGDASRESRLGPTTRAAVLLPGGG